jgi:hypothetical protein
MGLDMYLYKKTYVRNWEHNGPDKQHEIIVNFGGKKREDIKPERISYIIEQVGYWRKFNALHGWFVKNCGKGIDECQEIPVSENDLTTILGVLKQVKYILDINKPVVKVLQDWNGQDYEVVLYDCEEEIRDILSPTNGFFRGSEVIDEYYKEDVERSIELFESILEENKIDEGHGLFSGDFYYQASW